MICVDEVQHGTKNLFTENILADVSSIFVFLISADDDGNIFFVFLFVVSNTLYKIKKKKRTTERKRDTVEKLKLPVVLH